MPYPTNSEAKINDNIHLLIMTESLLQNKKTVVALIVDMLVKKIMFNGLENGY